MIKRDDIDLVINSSFSYRHVEISMAIMDAGKHCLSEKPFAQKVADVDMLIKKAEEKNVLLTVFQQSRFVPWFEQVKSVIGSGVLGRIFGKLL
ncbi:MAG: Gfo/Idh/MocA family oxidoreductase [Spirochaetales bacterium]|nr:Gfo/Idh/MocA family oxidoreductase [Spirochaetales bacterium]